MERLRRDMNRLFEDRETPYRRGRGFPAANVWMGEDDVMVTAELPGVNPDDVNISVHGETLTITGKRAPETLKEGERFHRRERSHGEFTRTMDLPFRVDADKVAADFKAGILSIRLPRAEADKPRKITVKAA